MIASAYIYPARWASFIANAGIVQVFSVNEPGTAEYLSKMLGSRTVAVQGQAASRSHSPQGAAAAKIKTGSPGPCCCPRSCAACPARRKYCSSRARGRRWRRASSIIVIRPAPASSQQTRSGVAAMAGAELPPPAHVLLAYAADGWAAENGRFNPSGKPKPPDPAAWRAIAAALLHEANGLDRLRNLELAGMAAWKVDPTLIACIAPASAKPDFAAALAWRLGIVGYREPEPRPAPAMSSEPAPVVSPPSPSTAPIRPRLPKPKA